MSGRQALAAAGHAAAHGGRGHAATEIARDERMVLFTTAARRVAGGSGWIVPVHGRIFRPPDSRTAKAALAIALKTGFGVSPDALNRPTFDTRCALMLADSCPGRRVVVTVAGADHMLHASDRNGQFRGVCVVRDSALATASSARLTIVARLPSRDSRQIAGTALLVEPNGLSVISDIDDTVKVTHVASRRRMMALTFLEPFEPVPGMARVYARWADQGAAFHFISSSPWPLYEPLDAFLADAGFPEATKTLKNVALKDRSIRNLLAKATKTKPPAIDAILKDFPGRQFVLIGDSVEKDAEIYVDVARRHPGRIARIMIRDCGGQGKNRERMERALTSLDAVPWTVFHTADELPASLT